MLKRTCRLSRTRFLPYRQREQGQAALSIRADSKHQLGAKKGGDPSAPPYSLVTLTLNQPRQVWLSPISSSAKTTSITRGRAPSPSKPLPPTIDEANLYRAHKVSTGNPFSFLQLLSFAFIALVLVGRMLQGYLHVVWADQGCIQIIQILLDNKSALFPESPLRYPPTSYSPPLKLLDQLICESPHPFFTEPPVSRPHKMSLLEEAKRVAAEFDYPDDEVRKSVKHFISQMGMLALLCASKDPVVRTEQSDIRLTVLQMRGWQIMVVL